MMLPPSLFLMSLTLSLSASQVDATIERGWAEVLTRSVKNGRVDYKSIAEKDQPALEAYIKALETVTIPSNKTRAIGVYVDAYNALVIRSVIQAHRPRSVLDVKDFFTAKVHKLAGRTIALDELEKQILNPLAQDPRTHMVLVCGAVGCPILDSRLYAGSDVNTRLDEAARRYLASPTGAQVTEGVIQLSKIFEWYRADFGGDAGVIAFAKQHLSPEAAKRAGATPKIAFLEYNWTLNQQ